MAIEVVNYSLRLTTQPYSINKSSMINFMDMKTRKSSLCVAFTNKIEHGTNTQNVKHILYDITYEYKYMLSMIIILALCLMVLGWYMFLRTEMV